MDFSTIPWQEVGSYSLIILCSLAFLSLIGMPFMAIAGQTLSLIRERSSYAKCAKQITLLALYLGWILCFVAFIPLWLRLSPSILSLMHNQESIAQGLPFMAYFEPILTSIYLQVHVYTFLLLLAATILISVFYGYWSVWKQHRLFLQCLAIVAGCWYAMALYCVLCIIHADALFALGTEHTQSLNNFLTPNFGTSIWNVMPYILPLSFSFAAGFSAVWLLIRRNRDDFGRDYYAQMLPWCAAWARNAWLVFWIILLIITGLQWVNLLTQENYLTNPEFLRSMGFLIMWLIPGILWAMVVKSAYPLRHKATLILAFIFALCVIIPLYSVV